MRTSLLLHPVSILRTTINLGQVEFGQLVGCSKSTIQSLECLRLKLSGSLAKKISEAAGVSIYWLLAANPSAQMFGIDGEPYTIETWERHRASGGLMPEDIPAALEKLRGIMERAKERGDFHIVFWKMITAAPGNLVSASAL